MDVKLFPENRVRTRLLRIIQWAIVVAIFVFLGRMVWDHWSQLKGAPFTFEAFPLFLATLLFAFSYFIQIWAWYLITLKLKIALSPSETLKTWFYSQLGKYLPGKMWVLLGRVYFYESRGKSKKSISVALYFEMVTMIMAAGLIFLASLLLFKEIGSSSSGIHSGWLALLFSIGFLSLHPRVLEKILNWTLVRLKREPLTLSISYFDILWILFICIVSWVVGGVGFYLFVDSLYPISSKYVVFLTGALAISSTLGLVAIFAPGGLGVREGVLVYLLSMMMPAPVAVIISVLTRLWMTLIEIGLIGVIYSTSFFQKRSRWSSSHTGKGEVGE